MKTNKTQKLLSLKKDTVRRLDAAELDRVAAGATTTTLTIVSIIMTVSVIVLTKK